MKWPDVRPLVVLLPMVTAAHATNVSGISADLQAAPTLGELVHSFFRSNDQQKRASLIPAIEEAANNSIKTIAQTIKKIQI